MKIRKKHQQFLVKVKSLTSLECITVTYTINDNNAVVVCRFQRRKMRWLSVNSIDCLKPLHSFHINWTLTTCTVNQFHWDMPWSLSSSMFLLLFYFILLYWCNDKSNSQLIAIMTIWFDSRFFASRFWFCFNFCILFPGCLQWVRVVIKSRGPGIFPGY